MIMKYKIDYTKKFKKQYKLLQRQGKDLNKLHNIIEKLASEVQLDVKYRNHLLINNKYFKNCMECHIEPDWLLVYQVFDKELILLLVETGSHSDIFK